MGRADLSPEQYAVTVCREMGWTLAEYEAQPATFVTELVASINAEGKELERRRRDASQR